MMEAVSCPACDEPGVMGDQLAPGQHRCPSDTCSVITFATLTVADRRAIRRFRKLMERHKD